MSENKSLGVAVITPPLCFAPRCRSVVRDGRTKGLRIANALALLAFAVVVGGCGKVTSPYPHGMVLRKTADGRCVLQFSGAYDPHPLFVVRDFIYCYCPDSVKEGDPFTVQFFSVSAAQGLAPRSEPTAGSPEHSDGEATSRDAQKQQP